MFFATKERIDTNREVIVKTSKGFATSDKTLGFPYNQVLPTNYYTVQENGVEVDIESARITPGYNKLVIIYYDQQGTQHTEYFTVPFYGSWVTTSEDLNELLNLAVNFSVVANTFAWPYGRITLISDSPSMKVYRYEIDEIGLTYELRMMYENGKLIQIDYLYNGEIKKRALFTYENGKLIDLNIIKYASMPGPGAESSVKYVHYQSEPSDVWQVQHNLNTKNFVFQVYDENDQVRRGYTLRIIDENTFELIFASSVTGRVVVFG